MNAYQLSILRDAPGDRLYAGTVIAFCLEVRDRFGSLTTPEQPANVTISSVAEDSTLTLVEESTACEGVLDDGETPTVGNLVCEWDTTNVAAGQYQVRFEVPYGAGAVPAAETFTLYAPGSGD